MLSIQYKRESSCLTRLAPYIDSSGKAISMDTVTQKHLNDFIVTNYDDSRESIVFNRIVNHNEIYDSQVWKESKECHY